MVTLNQVLSNQYVNILVTGLFTSFLTYWLTQRRDKLQLCVENRNNVIKLVYAPIIKIIYDGIWPAEGYEGLNESQVNQIIEIVNEHELFVDDKIRIFIWAFREEVYYNNLGNKNNDYYVYDGDRKFLDYVIGEYNRLKKEVGLPYDKNYIGFRGYLRPIKLWFTRQKIYRKIRRITIKIGIK